jgi:uncharacterized protein GlcG (DUF336 family)
MTDLTLAAARTIVEKALAHAHAAKFKPIGVVVVDARGLVRAAEVEDGSAFLRFDIAHGKAFGCVAVGVGGRTLQKFATERPHFITALGGLTRDRLTPVPGGVLIRDQAGALIGAVGISGDTSDNDELAAIAGIEAAGFKADTGA